MNLRKFSTLQLALGISVAVHAVLLTVRFVNPEAFNRVFEDTPLEVILVNARSNEKPDKAQAIAQFALAGGGEAAKGRATSPLPPSALSAVGDAMEEEARRKVTDLREEQTQMLTQLKKQLNSMAILNPKEPNPTPEQLDREEKRRQLVKVLAEIERRINLENARPRKRYVSPSTRNAAYAVYYDGVRRKIEDKGTQNFPEAGGKKLYGELTMIVTVNFDGQVIKTEVVASSGNTTLDRRAEAIAQSSGPFGAFDANLRREADQLAMVSRFKFTREETLEASLTGQ